MRWSNPQSGHSGTVRSTRDGTDIARGAYCREYQQTIIVGGCRIGSTRPRDLGTRREDPVAGVRSVIAGVALAVVAAAGGPTVCARADAIPILVYHRFGPVAADPMTVTTPVFENQLRALRELGYTIVPLRALVDFRLGKAPSPPPRAVVITADDGHRSVYTEMRSVVYRERIPVTLFVYPSAISRADYALTWGELRELAASGLFDVQSHTFWHPHFRREKRRLAPAEYDRFVTKQLVKSREVLERELGARVDLLAWPFGIHDDDLARRASAAGYVAAFTLEARPATWSDDLMTLPRFLMTDAHRGKAFERLLGAGRVGP